MMSSQVPWYKRLWEEREQSGCEWPRVVERVDRLASMVDLTPGRAVLDVACGAGGETVEMAARGLAVTGLDLSSSMLQEAKRRARERRVQVHWLCMDMRDIAFRDVFDVVMVRDVIFGIFDRLTNDSILDQLVKALRPDGELLLEVYNKTFALEHGIERILRYNEVSGLFEGVIAHKSLCGHAETLCASVDLRTVDEWRDAFCGRNLRDFRCRTPDGGHDCEQSRIILVRGQRLGKIGT